MKVDRLKDNIIHRFSKSEQAKQLADRQSIENVCRTFREQSNLVQIIKVMNANGDLKMLSPSAYIMGKHKFIVGSRDNLQEYYDVLQILKNYHLTSCPSPEKFVVGKNPHYSMMILRSPEDESLMIGYMANKDKANLISKCNFVEEMERVANKTGMYNPILQNPEILKITSTGDLYVSDWSEMESFATTQEKQEYFKMLKNFFNLILM